VTFFWSPLWDAVRRWWNPLPALAASCPDCGGALQALGRITAPGPTEDERAIALLRCRACERSYLNDWIETAGWDGAAYEVVERLLGPLHPADAESVLAGLQACPRPLRKSCRCPVHAEVAALTERLPTRGLEPH
jgi:hypothetical protein